MEIDVGSITITRSLPSCIVSKKLLLDIERHTRQLLAGDQDAHFSITIFRSGEQQTFDSINLLVADVLPDYTESVDVAAKSGTGDAEIKFEFGHPIGLPMLTVKVTAPDPRPTALGFSESMLELVRAHRTFYSLLYYFRNNFFRYVIVGGLCFSALTQVYLMISQPKPILYLPALYFLVAIYVLSWFWPYVAFDTITQRRNTTIGNYLIISIVISGIAIPVLRSYLL